MPLAVPFTTGAAVGIGWLLDTCGCVGRGCTELCAVCDGPGADAKMPFAWTKASGLSV